MERTDLSQTIQEYKGPVLDYTCNQVCDKCRKCIRNGQVPRLALVNNLWLGTVPKELSVLNWVEKVLVSRVRHNACFVRIACGLPDGFGPPKMICHVVAFEAPVPKIYAALPPPIDELDEVLAILFTGPCKPTTDDFKRVWPLLVRRNHVAHALEWLKLNHPDYADLEIAYANLKNYPEDVPPVSIIYKEALTNKIAEATSVFDMELNDGTQKGDCLFVVHGLMSEHLETKSANALIKVAKFSKWVGHPIYSQFQIILVYIHKCFLGYFHMV